MQMHKYIHVNVHMTSGILYRVFVLYMYIREWVEVGVVGWGLAVNCIPHVSHVVNVHPIRDVQ